MIAVAIVPEGVARFGPANRGFAQFHLMVETWVDSVCIVHRSPLRGCVGASPSS